MTGRPLEFDRDQALDSAMDLFWHQGYEATGVAELCDHLGIGRQSLYNTFGDKHALFLEALRRYRERQLQPMIDLLRGPGSPLGNVEKVLNRWESRIGESDGCMMANTIAEFGAREPEFREQLSGMLGSMEEAFADVLERARDAGELSQDTDPRALARLLTTTGQGLSVVSKLETDGRFARDAIAAVRGLLR